MKEKSVQIGKSGGLLLLQAPWQIGHPTQAQLWWGRGPQSVNDVLYCWWIRRCSQRSNKSLSVGLLWSYNFVTSYSLRRASKACSPRGASSDYRLVSVFYSKFKFGVHQRFEYLGWLKKTFIWEITCSNNLNAPGHSVNRLAERETCSQAQQSFYRTYACCSKLADCVTYLVGLYWLWQAVFGKIIKGKLWFPGPPLW